MNDSAYKDVAHSGIHNTAVAVCYCCNDYSHDNVRYHITSVMELSYNFLLHHAPISDYSSYP